MLLSLSFALALTGVSVDPEQPVPVRMEQAQTALSLDFTEAEGHVFTDAERSRIETLLIEAYAITKDDFPSLPDQVSIEIMPINRPAVDPLGGVTGRAQRPGVAILELSVTYPGGVMAAAENNLRAVALHELHHLALGWTIENNQFGLGINIATAVEGLAEAYAETYEGVDTTYPPLDDATFRAWGEEILALPTHADYGQWMFTHPDGREAIGYRTGLELVRQAMEQSGLNIIEISALSPDEIWQAAGFELKEADQ